jgi:glycosyltransferase involved in cell wall biosynthesis
MDAYGREAEVIHAPIDFARYQVDSNPDDYYLVVSRLNRYKRIDLVIDAISHLGRRLLIVGEGLQRKEFERLALDNIHFLGNVSDNHLLQLYGRCKALIFPQEEDYGLTPIEAQASGRPVIAYGAGGVLETVIDGETGFFFRQQTTESLIEAILMLEKADFNPLRIRQHAAKFDISIFGEKISAFIDQKWREFTGSAASRLRVRQKL